MSLVRSPPFQFVLRKSEAIARLSRRANEIVQILADQVPPPIAQLSLQRLLSLLPEGQRLLAAATAPSW